MKELSKYITIPEEINETAILNDYAVQTRYPGGYTPIEEEEYNTAIIIDLFGNFSFCVNVSSRQITA
jgi:hypothetical protein